MTARAVDREPRIPGWEPWMGILIALHQDGMSQEQLAELLGWDPSKLSRIIAGVKSRGGKRQKLGAEELFDLSQAQNRPVAWYRYGPAATVEASNDKPGFHAPLTPVTDINEWARRPIPAEAVGF